MRRSSGITSRANRPSDSGVPKSVNWSSKDSTPASRAPARSLTTSSQASPIWSSVAAGTCSWSEGRRACRSTCPSRSINAARTFVPPKIFPGYEAQQGIGYDVERAKRLLAEAGYPNGGALPGVSYLFRSDLPSAKELAQNLTRQWKQKLNLDIPLE